MKLFERVFHHKRDDNFLIIFSGRESKLITRKENRRFFKNNKAAVILIFNFFKKSCQRPTNGLGSRTWLSVVTKGNNKVYYFFIFKFKFN